MDDHQYLGMHVVSEPNEFSQATFRNQQSEQGLPACGFSVRIVNRSQHRVVAIGRMGQFPVVPEMKCETGDYIEIQLEVRVNQTVINTLFDTSLERGFFRNRWAWLRQIFHRRFRMSEPDLGYGGFTQRMRGESTDYTAMHIYKVKISDLQDVGGVLYHLNTDLVLAIADEAKDPVHPFSSEGLARKLQMDMDKEADPDAPFYSVTIIDNTAKCPPLYYNVNGRVYKVVPKTDRHREDGIYVCNGGEVLNAFNTSERNITRHDNDPKLYESLGLYLSVQEAHSNGNLKERERIRTQQEQQKMTLMSTFLKWAESNRQLIVFVVSILVTGANTWIATRKK